MATQYDYGMIGLGTMGSNLVYNMCDHGFSVAGFDKDQKQVDTFKKRAEKRNVLGTSELNEFVAALKTPRVIMLLVPAGPIVDAVVNELKPHLSPSDLIMDCGNSHFTDTDIRIAALAKENLHFMGVGISGGEEGARFGPSIMPGGDKEVYSRVSAVLEAVSAKVNNEPCVTYLGPGSAGHYVKMVHNGIEYGLMQLISEAYLLLKEAGGLTNDELQQTFAKWNEGILKSFLIEITATIFARKDDLTGGCLIDLISDAAEQKGTGKWTSQDALDLGVPISIIDVAVTSRELSAFKDERVAAELCYPIEKPNITIDKKELIENMEQALYFSFITTYAQGMALLQHASLEHKYDLNLTDIARIWRGGCIIRATLLEQIMTAYSKNTTLKNILVDDFFVGELKKSQPHIRSIIQTGISLCIPLAVAYYLPIWYRPSGIISAHIPISVQTGTAFFTPNGNKNKHNGRSK
jgi:6-phosphogluconate dehydrogenase